MITISEEQYKIYGNCVSITNGEKKLLVTKDIGPRVIFYGIDGKNIMCEDLDDNINKGGEFFEKNLKGEGEWHLYGGHRFWKSPEYMDTYYPDNKPVDVVIIDERTVKFTSKIETTTKLQKTMIISMDENGNVSIQHEMQNMAKETSPKVAIWGLTVLDLKAVATIPLSTDDTGFLPNRNLVLWSYADLNDERLEFKQDHIKMYQKNIVDPIKIGTYVKDPITVNINGMIFTLEINNQEGEYPDFSCNVECYTNNHIFEIETLSPLKTLAPKEKMVHLEKWTLNKR